MTDYLVGFTGFVGSNLSAAHRFTGLFNSKNISNAFGGKPDLLVYAGVPAEMFLANKDPEKDFERIRQAMQNIEAIGAKQVVLVSSIAVYPNTHGADENTAIDADKLPAYGANRLALEQWVETNCPEHLIVRLPAIYGKNLKKNFIYDYMHVIPAMLSEGKFAELSQRAPELREFYVRQQNGFYKCGKLNPEEESLLKTVFRQLGFTALNFTDSRSRYQFYPLSRLWDDIQTALSHHLRKVNFMTPPVTVSELYTVLTGEVFVNELNKAPYDYDLKSRYADVYGGINGYLMSKKEEMDEVVSFINQNME